MRATVSAWIAGSRVQVIVATGGAGVTGSDGTPDAVAPLLDKRLEGFGELFRMLSYEEIGTSTLASCALGGVRDQRHLYFLSAGLKRRLPNRLDAHYRAAARQPRQALQPGNADTQAAGKLRRRGISCRRRHARCSRDAAWPRWSRSPWGGSTAAPGQSPRRCPRNSRIRPPRCGAALRRSS